MSSTGLESVLIGHPVDSERLSISRETVRSSGNGTSFKTDLFLHSALFHFDAVIGLVTVSNSTCQHHGQQ